MSNHERLESAVLAAIVLCFAAAMFLMSSSATHEDATGSAEPGGASAPE